MFIHTSSCKNIFSLKWPLSLSTCYQESYFLFKTIFQVVLLTFFVGGYKFSSPIDSNHGIKINLKSEYFEICLILICIQNFLNISCAASLKLLAVFVSIVYFNSF